MTIKRFIIPLVMLLLPALHSIAQSNLIAVQGRVGSDSAHLPDVNIVLKTNQNTFTRTNPNGTYSIRVPADGTLIFSMVGYETQEIDINGKSTINVVLKLKDKGMDDVTVIGFGGTRKRSSMVSSITTISAKDLQTNSGNITNAMAGRVAGMISFQTSGEPGMGSDNSTFYIRGLSTFGTGKQDPLILIDGIESTPTDMARIQPDDISDFSVLKDASAASVYGARGANGVVLINTKIGKEGTPKFFTRGEMRVSSNTKNLEHANNISYMELSNEAVSTRANGAVALPYTQNKINHTKAGDDPYLYPSNDWVKQLVRQYTINQNYYASVNGGTGKARYHVAASYGRDNGILKVDPINDFNSNIRLSKYSVRTTFNLNLTRNTELMIRMYGQFDDYQGPIGGRIDDVDYNDGGAYIMRLALRANPVLFPAVYAHSMRPYVSHPLFGSYRLQANGVLTSTLLTNPYAEMVRGYSVYKTSNLQPQIELKQNLDMLTKGLSFRTMAYLKRYSFYNMSRRYNPFYYYADVQPDGKNYNLIAYNADATTSGFPADMIGREYLDYQERAKDVDSRIWLEATLNYNRTFKAIHNVGGSLISFLSSYETGNAGNVTASLPRRNVGISGRFTYGYDDRYLAEFNFGYNGSERFDKEHRFGFFPSGGIGYRISNEKFFEPLLKTIDDLKFRATYGIVGNDQIGDVRDRFFYLSNVSLDNGSYGASFGRNDGFPTYGRNGVSISRYSNPFITWETSSQLNLGMDLRMFNSLELIVDVFKQTRSSILLAKSSLESALGLMATPQSNYGKAGSRGIDLSWKYERMLDKNWYANIRGTFTFAQTKQLVVDELQYDPSLRHLSRVGYPIRQEWGLIAERLFIDQKEVINSPIQFGDLGSGIRPGDIMAGDIKYRDVNNDGQINADDAVPVGFPTQPEIIYGFGASMRYKNFDFSFYFQGSARSSFFINARAIQPFVVTGGLQNGLLQSIADDHWSEEDRDPYAMWPRLSSVPVPNNNIQSTWWLRNGAFLRLKNVDLGYTFRNLKRYGLQGGRLYASGTNLALLSNFKLWDVEMGGNGLGYPLQSVYSLGLELNF